MKALSLFSGCGGLDLGLALSGIRTIGQVEKDPVCRETLALNTHETTVFGDVFDDRVIEFAKASGVEVIHGGPPCQPFSSIGRRRCLRDARGKALSRFVEIVAAVKPTVFLMENVYGLVTAQKGRLLRSIIRDLSTAGYHVTWKVVNAKAFGAPQSRRRLIVLGSTEAPIQIIEPTTAPVTFGDAVRDLDDPGECAKLSPSLAKYMRHIPEGGNWRDLSPRRAKLAMGNANIKSGGLTAFYRRLSFDRPSPTLTTFPAQRATTLCHPTELRPLSVAEYRRLQCFPDTWELAGTLRDKYRQLGNAVPVKLAQALGDLIRSSNRST